MEMLEQFRRDVNDAHAHAYDENNRYVQGSSGGNESTESTSQDEENDTENTTTTSSDVKDVDAGVPSAKRGQFQRLDSSYDFIQYDVHLLDSSYDFIL